MHSSLKILNGGGEASSAWQPKKLGGSAPPHKGVITEPDFEWESESEADYKSDSDHDESEVSKFIYSPTFKERVNKATKEELVEALNVIEFSIKSYENHKEVPAYKEQISKLIEKENICKSALENIEQVKFLEEENSKGKGKDN